MLYSTGVLPRMVLSEHRIDAKGTGRISTLNRKISVGAKTAAEPRAFVNRTGNVSIDF